MLHMEGSSMGVPVHPRFCIRTIHEQALSLRRIIGQEERSKRTWHMHCQAIIQGGFPFVLPGMVVLTDCAHGLLHHSGAIYLVRRLVNEDPVSSTTKKGNDCPRYSDQRQPDDEESNRDF